MTTTDDPTTPNHYTVSYCFRHQRREGHRDAVGLVLRAVAALQRQGVELRFLGATQELDATGRPVDVTVRFAAPSKGTIGQLNCLAGLPASGAPQRIQRSGPDPSARQQPAAVTTR